MVNNVSQNKKNSERIQWILIILALCAGIGYFGFGAIKHQMDKSKEMNRVMDRMETYKEEVSAEFPKFCQNIDVGVSGSYTASGYEELNKFDSDGKYLFYEVTAHSALTLNADSSFDRLEDREKYDALTSLYEQVLPKYDAFLKEYYPEFFGSIEWEVVPYLFVSYRTTKPEVFIQTPKHSYQYSLYYEDLYILDGENYYLMDEGSWWNRKPAKSDSTGSYSGSGTGSYGSGGYSYSDADDYADDYAEEYMDEGYDYDEAYEEAYDDWE